MLHVPNPHTLSPASLGSQYFFSISLYIEMLSKVYQPLVRYYGSHKKCFINRLSLSVSLNTTSKGTMNPRLLQIHYASVSLHTFFNEPVFRNRVIINASASQFLLGTGHLKNYILTLGYVTMSQER